MHRLPRRYYGPLGILRILVIATVVLVVGKEAAIRIQGDLDYKLKILPTDFVPLESRLPDALWPPQHPVRHMNGTNIDDRYIFMRHLGLGNEGEASLYVDIVTGEVVVVKTWFGPLKNIRNVIPANLQPSFAEFTVKWPSEIEASLLLASWNRDDDAAYVPVKDYFILRQDYNEWCWAMATPFIEAGTLFNLAKATKIHERTPQKLDKIFRPAFNSLLEKLGQVHDEGYCHDDIKPDNIFIANTTHWLLGDLGNVRHYHHPWHATGRWKRENQKPDCKENDIRRMLKTYMTFLREAGASESAFDSSFYNQDQAWSRLYWNYIKMPVSAQKLLRASRSLRSGDDGEVEANNEEGTSANACLSRKIDRELTFWSVKKGWFEWMPFRGC